MPTYLGNKLVSSSTSPDEQTITLTSNNTLQTQGVINSNSGNVIKYWTGTRAEYDAIVTKDANTLYNVVDDSAITYSMLELLYPIGSIYIGTMETCPMTVLMPNTVWELKSQDRVLQGAGTRGSVGDTLNESLPNIKGNCGGNFVTHMSSSQGAGALRYTKHGNGLGDAGGNMPYGGITFDASRSSSTYQDNAPVQQDAYLVNIWERVA